MWDVQELTLCNTFMNILAMVSLRDQHYKRSLYIYVVNLKKRTQKTIVGPTPTKNETYLWNLWAFLSVYKILIWQTCWLCRKVAWRIELAYFNNIFIAYFSRECGCVSVSLSCISCRYRRMCILHHVKSNQLNSFRRMFMGEATLL